MSSLSILGGTPVCEDFLDGEQLSECRDLERKYILQAYDERIWDDWPDEKESMAAKFEREWAEFNKSKFCALVTNGTHALQLALEVLDIGVGDEVIVPGLTWQATASIVCDVNSVPVLVDIDPETLCIDPKKIEQNISPRTRAIIPVHLYCRMADMDKILEIAGKYKLHVIEDAAHSHGSVWESQGAGTLSDFGSFSFQGSKLMNSGEGGALLMQDEEFYWKLLSLKSCGRQYREGLKVHSGNYRMTSFQAAILRGQLSALRKNAPRIDKISRALDKAIANAPGVKTLRRNPHVTRQCGYGFVFLYDKDAFDGLSADIFRRAISAELGIGFGSTYAPLNKSDVYFPHTKKRHHLSKSYLEAITPSRWSLPVCESIYRDEAVLSSWKIYACNPSQSKLLTDAITKIYENRKELFKDI